MTMRHMLMALGVLVVVALLVGGTTRACSFSPGGPSVDPGSAPVVDAQAQLTNLNKDVAFPVRVPAVPAEWRANSSGLDPVGDGSGSKVVRVGYLTADRHYLRVLQSDVAEDKILQVETGPKQVAANGPTTVGAQQWVVYGGGSNGQVEEPIWIADLGPVRVLITGSGTDDDYRSLAAAVAGAQPLAK
jgi:hypothetical protein